MCDEVGQISDEAVLRMVLGLIFVTHGVTIFVTHEWALPDFLPLAAWFFCIDGARGESRIDVVMNGGAVVSVGGRFVNFCSPGGVGGGAG